MVSPIGLLVPDEGWGDGSGGAGEFANWCDVPASLSATAWSTICGRVEASATAPEPLIVVARVGAGDWGRGMAGRCEALLAVLGRASIEVWQLAGFDVERIKSGEPFQRMHELRDAGKVRFFGVRVETARDACWAMENTPAHAVTLDGPITDDAWGEVLAVAEEVDAGVLATHRCVGGDRAAAERLLRDTPIAGFAWPG